MRKIRLLFLAMSVAALAGCTADMDKFTERLDELEARVAVLEELCTQMNEDISSMKTVISALEEGLYITDVRDVDDGYLIEFSNGDTITIHHGEDGEDGKDGADGADGYTPVIGVRMDTDGIYYWTLDGEWLLDDEGNKMRVTGEDGNDGVTPVIGIAQDEDGIYYWIINGEWLLDENGNKVQAQYLDGAGSGELIEDIVVDDMGITFILSDGSELYIPLYEAITITFDAEDLLVMEPGSERDIHYTIESRLEDIRIEVLSSSDIRARVVPTDAFTGVINIRTGSSLDEYSKVVVFATNGEKMLMRTITFEEAELYVTDASDVSIGMQGGDIQLFYMSNLECEVSISPEAQSWLSVSQTKAVEEHTLWLSVAMNEGEARTGTVVVGNPDGLHITYTINQAGTVSEEQRVLEREALIAIYNALGGPDWKHNDNWCSDNPLEQWYGVVIVDGSVYSLYLDDNNLNGEIPRELGNLKNLNTLSMNANNIKGPIPEEIGELTELQYLYMHTCGLEGTLPNSIGNLVKLKELNLSWNSLSGQITEKIGALVQLTNLNLSQNELSGPIPSSIGKLTQLTNLCLEYNQLSGSIPESIGEMTSLSFQLRLDNNQLTGRIPASIGNLTNLRVLELGNNLLEEVIPESIGNMSELVSCNFFGNMLSGNIPESIGNLKKLEMLSLDHNQLSGDIPESIGEMTNIKELYFGSNLQLTGEIPACVADMENLMTFGINNTGISGEVSKAVQDSPVWRKSWPTMISANNVNTSDVILPAPDFKAVKTMSGKIISDEIYDENTLTVLFSWGDNCSLSLAFIPMLKDLCSQYEDMGLGVLCYSDNESNEAIQNYMTENEITWETFNYYENIEDFTLNKVYYPSVNVVDRDHNIVFRHVLDDYLNLPEFLEQYYKGEASDLYESTDYSADCKVEVMQSATVGNGIDVVLMGDAYSDRLISDGTYRSVMENTMEQFFSEEPYKSFREYFNVYMVNVISPNEVYEPGSRTALSTWFGDGTSVGGNDQAVFNYALNAISEDRMDEALIVVMMNRDYYAGTCWMYYPQSGDYGNGVSVAYFPTSSDAATFRGLILHEAGGHGFAKLADEYAYEEYGQIPPEAVTECQNLWDFGWYPNIDFTSDPNLVNWSEFISDIRYQYDGLGAFEGGYTYWTGVWRPTENSIMRYNEGGFNAPSREAIYTRINKLAYGGSWQYDYEDFVAYDAVNRHQTESAASSASVLRRYEPTSPPVIVRKTWREVME